MTASNVAPSPHEDGARKVAALLITMGKPAADRVLKHFSEAEIRRVVETMASLGTIPRSKLEEFVSEIAVAMDRGADVRAGLEDVEGLLAGVIQPERLASIMSGIRSDTKQSVWLRLKDIPETSLMQFLSKEHPQVAAFVLSKLTSSAAAAVLRQMPSGLRSELVRRILAMRPVTDAGLSAIEHTLKDELLAKVSKGTGPPVHSRVADIINKMERQQMEEVLTNLDQHRPKDAKLVKGLLFTFDDIARLSPADRVKLFDDVPAERTILALQGTPASLRELVLSSVSSRSRRMIEQEVASASNVPAREVAKARRAIADLALELADRGVIDIGQQQEEI